MAQIRNIEDWIAEIIKQRNQLSKTIKDEVSVNSGVLILKPLKLRLFNQGKDGKGNLIGDGIYSPNTIRQKRKRGIRTHPVTLRWEGNFYKSMFVETQISPFKTEIRVKTDSSAKDEPHKTQFLINKYGEDILSLTSDEEKILAERLSKKIAAEINSIKLPTINFR